MTPEATCGTCSHWLPTGAGTGGCQELDNLHGNHLAYLHIVGAGAFPEGMAVIVTRPEFGCVLWQSRALEAQP